MTERVVISTTKIKDVALREDYTDILHEVHEYAQSFLYEMYGMELTIPIRMNGRLKRAIGRLTYKHQNGRWVGDAIELSKEQISWAMLDDNMEFILNVVRHELVHYVFCERGLDHLSDGSAEFEAELQRVNAMSTGTNGYFLRYKRTGGDTWYKWNEWQPDKALIELYYSHA